MLLENSVSRGIISSWFSTEYIHVSITHSGGKPLAFSINPDEGHKLKALRKSVADAVHILATETPKDSMELATGVSSRLNELKKLLDTGVISESEFNEQKARILNNL
jgi:hypothetical protein